MSGPTERETYLSVPSAIEAVTGQRPHPATCWRWCIHGIGGIRLHSWMLGRRRCTTIAAVEEFIAQRTRQQTPAQSSVKTRAMLDKELA